MGDEDFAESGDTSAFEDVGADFSDADDFSEPTDAEDLLDDVPPEPTDAGDILDDIPPEPTDVGDILDDIPPEPTDAEDLLDDVPPEPTDAGDILDDIPPEPTDAEDLLDDVPPVEELPNDVAEAEEVNDAAEESVEALLEETEPPADDFEESEEQISGDEDGDVLETDEGTDGEEPTQQDVAEEVGEVNEEPEEDVSEALNVLENTEVDDTAAESEAAEDLPQTEETEEAAEGSDMAEEASLDAEPSAYKKLTEYYYEHNYKREDYEEYSQDPEWQELNNAYLKEIGKEPIDYGSEAEDASNGDINGEVEEISPLENLDKWLKEINPNFDVFDTASPYSNNCGSCAYAVYQRLEGNPDACATAENIGYNSDMEALTGMKQVSMSPQEIEERLLEQGEGAHAIIGVDRAEGVGHWFNAANIGGKVVAIDGQDGSVTDWPPDYGDVVNWKMSVKV